MNHNMKSKTMSFEVSNISCWMMFCVVCYLPSLRVGDLFCHLCHLMRMEDAQSEHHVWISPWNTETSEMRESNIRQWWKARITLKRKKSEPSLMWPKMSVKLAAQDHIQEILCGIWLDAQVRSNLLSNPRLSAAKICCAAHVWSPSFCKRSAAATLRAATWHAREIPLENRSKITTITIYFHICKFEISKFVESLFWPRTWRLPDSVGNVGQASNIQGLLCSILKKDNGDFSFWCGPPEIRQYR